MECLVTTLHDSITDENLLKLGEMAFKITDKENSITSMDLKANEGTEMELQIRGNGYFTNATGTSNLGKNMTITYGSAATKVYFSKGNYIVVISGKYNINTIGDMVTDIGVVNIAIDITNFTGANISSLYFQVDKHENIVGDLSAFTGMTNLYRCDFNGANITGDISALKDSVCYYVQMSNCEKIYGNINTFTGKSVYDLHLNGAENIEGDLSSLSGCTQLKSLWLHGCPKITGELTDLANLTNLQSLTLNDTQVTGDTSDLAGLTNLTTFWYTNTDITGTWPLT